MTKTTTVAATYLALPTVDVGKGVQPNLQAGVDDLRRKVAQKDVKRRQRKDEANVAGAKKEAEVANVVEEAAAVGTQDLEA